MVRELQKDEFLTVNKRREGFIFKKMPDGSIKTVEFVGFRSSQDRNIFISPTTNKPVLVRQSNRARQHRRRKPRRR